jgi:hypothetical protein
MLFYITNVKCAAEAGVSGVFFALLPNKRFTAVKRNLHSKRTVLSLETPEFKWNSSTRWYTERPPTEPGSDKVAVLEGSQEFSNMRAETPAVILRGKYWIL